MPHKDPQKRLEYAKRYNAGRGEEPKHQCACGRLIWRGSTRCRSCAAKARTNEMPKWKPIEPICPYCLVPMRLQVWRGQKVQHCPSCGLETTEMELRRIRLEQAA